MKQNWLCLVTLSWMGCQSAELARLGWDVEFSCPDDRSHASEVVLQITAGSCASDAPVMFEATLTRGQAMPRIDALAPGKYGFRAQARTVDGPIAQGCVESVLPHEAQARVRMDPVGGACTTSDAALPELDGSNRPIDAGDSSLPDASQTADAASDSDAADQHSDSDASSDPACASSCVCTYEPCVCSSVGCISAGLSLSFSGDSSDHRWQLSSQGAQLGPAAVVRVTFDPYRSAGTRILAQPAPEVLISDALFSQGAELDALATLADGRLVLSTSDDAVLGQEPFDDDDLMAFDPLNQGVSRYLDLGTYLGSVSGSDVDVDAIHLVPDGTLYFSVDDDVKVYATGAVFGADDLLRFDGESLTRVVKGASAWNGRDLENIAVDPQSGNFLISLAGTGAIGAGPVFGPSDVVELAFGPEQPFHAGTTLFMQAAQELPQSAGSLTTLQFGL
ncbi:MAG: hypothetical protein QM778_23855 [Myxococcales bacterium]